MNRSDINIALRLKGLIINNDADDKYIASASLLIINGNGYVRSILVNINFITQMSLEALAMTN